MAAPVNRVNTIKHVSILFTYLLIFWGFYRFLIDLPDTIEEIIIKPIFWLLPVIYFIRKEGRGIGSIGIKLEKLFPTLYVVISLGVVFAFEGLLINYVKYNGFDFSALISEDDFTLALVLSFLTAFTEEITFRGYMFSRLWETTGREWMSNIIISIGWVLIHVPIAILQWEYSGTNLLTYLSLVFCFSLGAAFLYARTRNVFSSILLHVLWQWPIILFR